MLLSLPFFRALVLRFRMPFRVGLLLLRVLGRNWRLLFALAFLEFAVEPHLCSALDFGRVAPYTALD